MADLSVVRKMALLSYLDRQPASVAELAAHFRTSVKAMRAELTELFVMEIPVDGFYQTFVDVIIPEDDETAVRLISNDTQVAPALTLAEVVSVLAAIDEHIGVVDSHTRSQLMLLRERLTAAVSAAGYGSVLWPAPTVYLKGIADGLASAIKERRYVRLSYLKTRDLTVAPDEVTIAPITVTTGARPLLVAGKEGQLRTYRLDRIAGLEAEEQTFSKRCAKTILDQFALREPFAGDVVTLRCTSAARWVAEAVETLNVTEDDGYLTIDLAVSSLSWLRTLIIRMGQSVIGIEPEHVARELAAQARTYMEES